MVLSVIDCAWALGALILVQVGICRIVVWKEHGLRQDVFILSPLQTQRCTLCIIIRH